MNDSDMQGTPTQPTINNLGMLPKLQVRPSRGFLPDYGYQRPNELGGIDIDSAKLPAEMSWLDRATKWAPAAQAFSGLANSVMGLKQYKLAKESFGFNKQMALKNYANQAQRVNGDLEDRQRARLASNPGAYQALPEYMDKNGVR